MSAPTVKFHVCSGEPSHAATTLTWLAPLIKFKPAQTRLFHTAETTKGPGSAAFTMTTLPAASVATVVTSSGHHYKSGG